MSTHYTAQNVSELNMSQRLMLKGYCGTKATFNAALDYSENPEHVDCKRCINKMEKNGIAAEAAEPTEAAKKAARISAIHAEMAKLAMELIELNK